MHGRVSKRRKNPTLFCVEVATLLWVISSTQLLNVTLEIFFGESAPCLGPGKEKGQIYLPAFMRFKRDNYKACFRFDPKQMNRGVGSPLTTGINIFFYCQQLRKTADVLIIKT